ncbi:FMR1 neighbor protein [Microcebus murinus]|uniref:FMR1 neighbor protein n=1 Tax=Microcebus murinus TaxID=30608 RepID=UPI000643A875|nr:fragile X mental retardation 1 neighbor protein [Microcebus murinus]
MPSEGRRRRRGRTRSKSRGIRGASSRLVACEAECNVEIPATGSHPGGSNAGQEAIMAATPQPSWQASVRGFRAETRRSLVKMWAHKRLRLLILCIWVLPLLCYYMSPGFPNSLSPNDYILWNKENADGQLLEDDSAWGILLHFFFPTTCILKENQVAKPCKQLQDLNESECLRYKCCFSSLGTSGFSCYAPLRDKPTQMFRMFGLGAFSMIILGWLPLYCFSLCRRSKWANPLRRKVNRMLRGLKKQRKKQKRDAEILETEMEDKEDDEKEQETRALLSQ